MVDKKMKYLNYQLYGFLSALLMLLSMTGCDSSESIAQSENGRNQAKAVKVSVVEVTPVPIKDILILPGQTEAFHDILVPADTGGRVEWIGPKEGDTVKKGQLLARIDVSALEAALKRAEAAFKLADDLYQRRRMLFERKIINQEELDRSLTERVLAEANLRQARVEHERGFLLAPIKGIINHLFVDKGEFIERGKAVIDLVNVDKIKININVPELDVRYLKPEQEALVTIDAFPNQRLLGTVDFIAFKADPATKTFLVRVLIKNPNHDIRPGMISRVVFLRRVIPDALTAPLFAIVDKGGERLLFVEKDGVAHARTVSIGVIEGDRVQIKKGLYPGDHLIVTGQTQVEEGMKVQVQ
jgi:membrane fusion protein (multidrug efflux system)